jgi:methionyl-tRNA formyltransferase
MNMLLFCNHTYGLSFAEAYCRYCVDMKLNGRLISSIYFGSDEKRSASEALFEKLKSTYSDTVQIESREVNDPEFIASIAPDSHAVVAGFNQIFRRPLIERFESLVNIHPSVLPAYRGPIPSYWCLKNNETSTGYSLHRLTEKIDQGPILYQEEIPILAGDDAETLDRRIASKASITMTRYFDAFYKQKVLEKSLLDARKVYHTQADYLSFIDKENDKRIVP